MQESEIKSFQFCSIDEIKERVLKKMFVRIWQSMTARENDEMVYYETVYKM
jgi:hypothetical protein